MKFDELLQLIEYCLGNTKTIDKGNFQFVTQDADKVSKYIDILEGKLPTKLKSSLPKSLSEYKKESEERINFKREEYISGKIQKNLLEVFIDTERRWIALKESKNTEKISQRIYEIESNKYQSQMTLRRNVIKKMRLDNINLRELSIQTLNWQLLPTGEIPFHQLRNYLQEVSKFSKDEFDCEKIEKIISLKADTIYRGIDDFDGYLVFYFEKLRIAVLDCPKKGNAIYIFGENWKNLSRLSKFELLNYHSDKTERIIHRGDWFERLELFLKTCKRDSHHD